MPSQNYYRYSSRYKGDLKTVDRGTQTDQIRDCDVCGFTWPEIELIMQDGVLKCPLDWDSPQGGRAIHSIIHGRT